MPKSEKDTDNLNLIRTKLFIPKVRENLIPRPDLFERLDVASLGKLTLVSAPAGYGKTTLVSAWAQQTEQLVTWLSLDENDNDFTRFWSYFIYAVRRINESFGGDILIALQSSQTPHMDALLTMLINELSGMEKQFNLVLDDCHLMTSQYIYDAIDFLLDHIPPNIHLVIIGRVEPPLTLSRIRVAGLLREIRENDLRFTPSETTAFLNELMGLELSPDDISALEERTEGWIAGLQLAGLSLQGRNNKREFVKAFSGSHIYIVDYLLEEVMSLQKEDIQHFLYKTSIFDRFCAQLCDDTLNITNSRQILRKLEDANLFLVPLDNERRWFRYHHLFDDFLLRYLEENHPESISELHHRAAKWYDHHGYISEALGHFLKAEDFDAANFLVKKNARQMFENSELARIMRFVGMLPEEQVRDQPWLCIYHAWALRLSGRPFDVVQGRLNDAEHAIENLKTHVSKSELRKKSGLSKDEEHRMYSHVYTIRAFQALYSEDIPSVLELAHQALEYRPDSGFVRGFIEFALGWAYRFSGDLEASSTAFNMARNEAAMYDNVYLSVVVTCRAAYNHVLGGELHRAADYCLEALQTARGERGTQFPVAGYAHVYLGGVHHEWNDLETATRHILQGIKLCERVGYIMDQAVGYVLLSRVHRSMGEWDAALDALQNAGELSRRMKDYLYVRRWVEDCQVKIWLAQGNLDKVAQWIQECGMTVDDEITYNRDMEHIILARALIGLGRKDPHGSHMKFGLTLLTELLDMAEKSRWFGKAIEIMVLQVLAFRSIGKEDDAIKVLEKALNLANPEGYIRTFVDEGESMKEMLQLVEKRAIAPRYVRRLLAAFDPFSARIQPPYEQLLVEPLSKRELEVLRLLATELSGMEIAEELMVALSTVRYHTNNIFNKLSVHKRRAAVKRAKELNIL